MKLMLIECFKQIHHNINIGIHICYNNDNSSVRYINEICEFYLNESNEPITHVIYSFDHKTKNYRTTKIQSPQIIGKFIQKHTDLTLIKGVFI